MKKKIYSGPSTPEELDRSAYAKMADALDLLEEAYEIAIEVRDGLVAKHGATDKDFDNWVVWIHHALSRGEQIRPSYRWVEYK